MRELSNGGIGVVLMKLDDKESLLAMQAVDDRGVIITGTGRGGKARDIEITKRSFEGFKLHRARKGRVVGLTWKAEKLLAVPEGEVPPDSNAPESSGLVLELEEP